MSRRGYLLIFNNLSFTLQAQAPRISERPAGKSYVTGHFAEETSPLSPTAH